MRECPKVTCSLVIDSDNRNGEILHVFIARFRSSKLSELATTLFNIHSYSDDVALYRMIISRNREMRSNIETQKY